MAAWRHCNGCGRDYDPLPLVLAAIRISGGVPRVCGKTRRHDHGTNNTMTKDRACCCFRHKAARLACVISAIAGARDGGRAGPALRGSLAAGKLVGQDGRHRDDADRNDTPAKSRPRRDGTPTTTSTPPRAHPAAAPTTSRHRPRPPASTGESAETRRSEGAGQSLGERVRRSVQRRRKVTQSKPGSSKSTTTTTKARTRHRPTATSQTPPPPPHIPRR